MIQKSQTWVCIQTKLSFKKNTQTSMFIASLFTIAKTWKQPKRPLTDKWFKKIHKGILLNHIKEQNNAMCSDMDETRDSHTKWSKSERERQMPHYHLYVESKIWHKWNYLQNRNKLMDMENRPVVANGEGKGVGWTGSLGLVDANYYIENR